MTLGFDLSSIQKQNNCETYFETGLGYCDIEDVSLKQALKCDFNKCFSLEIDERFTKKGEKVFENEISEGRCKLITDDSTNLKKYLTDIQGRTLFFLDAHIQTDMGDKSNYKRICPLLEELQAISTLEKKDHIICIDDLRIITGCKWGDHGDVEDLLSMIKKKVLEINSDYKFGRLDGHIAEDVLYCYT